MSRFSKATTLHITEPISLKCRPLENITELIVDHEVNKLAPWKMLSVVIAEMPNLEKIELPPCPYLPTIVQGLNRMAHLRDVSLCILQHT